MDTKENFEDYESALDKFLDDDNEQNDTINDDNKEEGDDNGLQKQEEEQINKQEEKIESDDENSDSGSKIKVNINGVDVEFEPDEAKQLLQESLEAKEKYEQYKNIIDTLSTAQLDKKLIYALNDALNGDDDALKFLVSTIGSEKVEELIDNLDDEDTIDYEPKVENNIDNEIQNIVEKEIRHNKEIGAKIINTFESLPDKAKIELYNPQIFKLFVEDVKNGIFEQLLPDTLKNMTKGLNFLESYKISAQNFIKKQQKEDFFEKNNNNTKPVNTKDDVTENNEKVDFDTLFDKFISD